MKLRNCLLCMAAALLMLGAVARPGVRIVVNGSALPGVYPPDTVLQCHTAVVHTAQEITRTSAPPPYTIVPVLCRRHDAVDPRLLSEVLLESYDGVTKLYAVSLGNRELGKVSDLRTVYRLQSRYAPTEPLTVRTLYTYPEAETPTEAMEVAFRAYATSKQV